jgi:hypothetical protein
MFLRDVGASGVDLFLRSPQDARLDLQLSQEVHQRCFSARCVIGTSLSSTLMSQVNKTMALAFQSSMFTNSGGWLMPR